MNATKWISDKRISEILNLINIGISVLAIIYYSINAFKVNEFNKNVDIYLVLSLVCCAIYVFAEYDLTDILNLVSVVFITLAIGNLIVSSINTFADALNGISMFGSSGQIGHIIVTVVMISIMLILEIISCFMSREKRVQ